MATIFRKDAEGMWCGEALLSADAGALASSGVWFVAFMIHGRRHAAIIVRDGCAAFVNGEPVIGGLRVLTHQDEIYASPERFYVSGEERPLIVRLKRPEDRAVRCALCRDEIGVGEEFVQCPKCGRRFHQSSGPDADARRCFTYKEACVCDHPTTLSGELSWTPDTED